MPNADPNSSLAPLRSTSAAAPEARAIEGLFRAHYARLHSYGRRLTVDEGLVEDAIQDVFLALWRSPTRAADLEAPQRYLLTALRRRIRARQQSDDRRRSRNEAYAAEHAFHLSAGDLNTAALPPPDRQQATAALCDLSPRRREAVYLRFFHDLPYRDVAAVMDIAPQTARNYVSEALATLRQRLTEASD